MSAPRRAPIPELRRPRSQRGTAGVLLASLLFAPTPALADNPLNSSEKPPSPASVQRPAGGKDDLTLVPVAGGSTDIGVAVGYFAALTRNQAGYLPYRWNIESAGLFSGALQNGGVVVPYIDVYAKLTVPRLLELPLELEVRPSFTDEQTLYYYGMGNASSAAPPAGQSTTYFQYGRVHPSVLADVRFKLLDHVAGITGLRYTGSWLRIPGSSRLADDERRGSAEVRSLIGPTSPASVMLFTTGIQLDTRDDEITTHAGTFDTAKFSLSPGGTADFPFRYGEASVDLRGYIPLLSRLTLAARVVGHLLFGDAPFVELPRFEDTYAVGGTNGVRGVPAQRYYGKVTVFGNVEVRARLVDFHAFSKQLSLGLAAFFDGGRVWADTTPHPELDGAGIGLKYGVGGGLRVASGSAFVLRADLAWSPDATPIGAYVAAGEMF
jgi:hypothetical protein